MKAVIWVDYGKIEVKEIPIPDIKHNEVLVKVKASSVCTTDIIMIKKGLLGLKPPKVIGHEVAGIVENIGQEVRVISIGERVTLDPPVPCRKCKICLKGFLHLCRNTLHIGAHTDGGLAEYIAIDYRNVYSIPQKISFEEASLTEPVAVCLEAISMDGGVKGKNVVIFGDGPFGIILSKLALLDGAVQVIAIGHHDGRLERIKKYGGKTINSHHQDLVKEVMDLTEEMGADVIIDAIGSSNVIEEYFLDILAERGKAVLFSNIDRKVSIDLEIIHFKEQTIVGSARSLNIFPKAIELMKKGEIKTRELITHKYELKDIHEAFEVIQKNKEEAIKAVIVFG